MKAVNTVLKPLSFVAKGGLVGAGVKAIAGGKKKPAAPAGPVRRDQEIINREVFDELARRRGGAADMLTGASGAEAPAATGKAVLGQ